MLVPDFTENEEKSMLLYFEAEDGNAEKMFDELEKTYVCAASMKKEIKDGKVYAVVTVDDEE